MPTALERHASSLFSTAVFRPILDGRPPQRANRILATLQSALGLGPHTTNQQIVSNAYALLRDSYRSEYYYKNLIANKILIGRHRGSNSVLIPEFRIHESVADCVFVNGRGTVYEIKTEFDSPEKLKRQLSSYYRAFSLVCVVAHANEVDRYLELLRESPAGLLAVGARQRLSPVKVAAPSFADLDVKTMFDSLRQQEVTSILSRVTGEVPDVPNGIRYSVFLNQALKIPARVFQQEMLIELKSRAIQDYRGLMLNASSAPIRALLVQLNPNEHQQRNLLHWLSSKER